MTTEEEVIPKAQQLNLIYAQFQILFEIIPDPPRYNMDFMKPNPRPHVDGIVGSIESPSVESLDNKILKLSVKHSMVEEAKATTPSPQNVDVYNTQSTQKGT